MAFDLKQSLRDLESLIEAEDSESNLGKARIVSKVTLIGAETQEEDFEVEPDILAVVSSDMRKLAIQGLAILIIKGLED